MVVVVAYLVCALVVVYILTKYCNVLIGEGNFVNATPVRARSTNITGIILMFLLCADNRSYLP